MTPEPTTTTHAVTRSDERTWTPFSPTSSFSFVAPGGPGLPELYEERSGRGDGPPLHRHPWPSWELVLEGTVRVQIDGEDHELGAGDVVHIPGGTPHAYVVESDEAHIVGMGLSDGRFPRLQLGAAPLMAAEGGPDMAAIGALAAEAGLEILGPPLAP